MQHSSMHSAEVVCRLLCSSRGLRASVMLLCRGLITATPGNPDRGMPDMSTAHGSSCKALARFLPRHAAMLQELDLSCLRWAGDEQWAAVSAVLARALWEAKDSLRLQSFRVCLSSPAVYQQVTAMAGCRRHLTQLVVYADNGESVFTHVSVSVLKVWKHVCDVAHASGASNISCICDSKARHKAE